MGNRVPAPRTPARRTRSPAGSDPRWRGQGLLLSVRGPPPWSPANRKPACRGCAVFSSRIRASHGWWRAHRASYSAARSYGTDASHCSLNHSRTCSTVRGTLDPGPGRVGVEVRAVHLVEHPQPSSSRRVRNCTRRGLSNPGSGRGTTRQSAPLLSSLLRPDQRGRDSAAGKTRRSDSMCSRDVSRYRDRWATAARPSSLDWARRRRRAPRCHSASRCTGLLSANGVTTHGRLGRSA